MEKFNKITEPMEIDFYSIEDDGNGGKQIHLLGYTYESDTDFGEGTWRGLEPCFCIVPLKEFIEDMAEDEDYIDNLIGAAKQYMGDYTEDGIVDYINNYYGDKPVYRLSYAGITEDTPCGNYVC